MSNRTLNRALDEVVFENGHPSEWTAAEAEAVFATFPLRSRFASVAAFVAACAKRAA